MKSGQALVVVLLILAVTATIGLSVASRSVTEVNLSSVQDDSSQALSAAESGIEAVLKDPSLSVAGPTPLPTVVGGGNSTYTIANKTAVGNSTSYVFPGTYVSGEYATLFLQTISPDGTRTDSNYWLSGDFHVCFGKTGSTVKPSLEATLYYRDSTATPTPIWLVKRMGYNPGDGSRPSTNGFTGVVAVPVFNDINCSGYQTDARINIAELTTAQMSMNPCAQIPCIPYFMRFRSLYNDSSADATPIKVYSTGGTFQPQGQRYEVLGASGQTARRVVVTQMYPVPPGILDNVLFSGGSL